ncbi:hypothetical protein vcoNHCC006C_001821A, partial [Vibrio cholerae O1 str. NHCC-006C]
MFNAGLR